MTTTLLRLIEHMKERRGGEEGTARMCVWAHNSHVGDASATGVARFGEWSFGQMMRQTLGGDNVFVLTFTYVLQSRCRAMLHL